MQERAHCLRRWLSQSILRMRLMLWLTTTTAACADLHLQLRSVVGMPAGKHADTEPHREQPSRVLGDANIVAAMYVCAAVAGMHLLVQRVVGVPAEQHGDANGYRGEPPWVYRIPASAYAGVHICRTTSGGAAQLHGALVESRRGGVGRQHQPSRLDALCDALHICGQRRADVACCFGLESAAGRRVLGLVVPIDRTGVQ